MGKSYDFYKKQKEKKKKDAESEIKNLFLEAENKFRKDKKAADRSVRKARRLAMKHKIRLPRELKRRFCKHCYSYLVPTINARVRLTNGKIVLYCMECRNYTRFPYTKEKKKTA